MSITLPIVEGPYTGLTYSSGDEDYARVVVGRSPEATFSLGEDRDSLLSRLHFMIEVNPPVCQVHDLKSKYGTFNGGPGANRSDMRDRK